MELLEINPTDYHSKLTCKRDDLFSRDSYLSKSVLWELKNRNLYQWRYHPKPFAGSDAAAWGSVVDCLITTPHELDEIAMFHDFDSFRTKEAREYRDDAKESGKILMHVDKLEDAKKAAQKIADNKHAARLLDNSRKQVVLIGESHGIQCKALVDVVPDGPFLCDIKTTGKWTREDLEKTQMSLGYHVQSGIYLHLWNQNFPDDQRKRWRIIWQQSEAPYEVTVTEMPTAEIAAGQEWAADQIEKLANATKSGHWPGIFGDRVPLLGRPDYAIIRDEIEREPLQVAPQ